MMTELLTRILKWRKRHLASAMLLILVASMLIITYPIYHETIEENQKHVLHNLWHSLGKHVPPPAKAKDRQIVFIHVPRTAADSMATHLFPNIAFKRAMIWPFQFKEALEVNDVVTVVDDEFKRVANLESSTMIKGTFSERDLHHLKQNYSSVIFLRHPIERVMSLLAMVHLKGTTGKNNVPHHFTVSELLGQIHGDEELFWCDTHMKNGMTWQLGYERWGGYRDRLFRSVIHNNSMMRTTRGEPSVKEVVEHELLTRAKQTVERAEFVGFYEALEDDFWRLKEQMFPGSPWFSPFAFWWGAYMCLPRLRVKRYSSYQMNSIDLERLKRQNELDMQLYEWARKRYKPDLKVYDTYSEFVRDNIRYTILALLVCVALVAACCASGRCFLRCLSLSCPSWCLVRVRALQGETAHKPVQHNL